MTNENSGNQEIGESAGTEEGQNSEQNPEWEKQAKYFQSEKDKLYQENQKLQDYKKIGEFLESRPDITQVVTNMAGNQGNGQPQTTERISLAKDEFDPWQAYNEPSSQSYKYRMQEMSDVVQSAVSEQVSGVKEQQNMQSLKSELEKRGLKNDGNENDTGNQDANPRPLDKVRETQNNPAYGGILGGETPKTTSDDDEMWNGIMGASGRKNVL
mgnify:CR=1 FL=1